MAGDTFGILIDVDAGSLTFFRNDYPVGMLTGMCPLAALYIHVCILLYMAVRLCCFVYTCPRTAIHGYICVLFLELTFFPKKTVIRLGMLAGVFALAAI